MRIVFTHAYFISEDPKEQVIMKPYPPLGILYVSAWLEQHGWANEVFDSTFSTFEAQCDFLMQKPPDVLAIYVNLMTRRNVLRLIRFVRQQPSLAACRIVLGGPEVRNHTEALLKYGADAIVLGEGEESMLALVQAYAEHTALPVAGTAVLDAGGAVAQGPERPLIPKIDVLPFPARDKIDLPQYFRAWKERHGSSAISVSTMRGCPYTCKWCSRAVYGLSYRRRSAALVVDELEYIQAHFEVDTVWFVDDVFTVSHQWLQSFASEVQRRGLKVRYECITRADRMNDAVIDLLKASGCFRVWIGAESGSQRIIDRMDRRVEVGKVREMIRAARRAGLEAGTFIMVGYPGETLEDIDETVHHLIQSTPDHYTITVAYPIKGTALYEEVEATMTFSRTWEEGSDRDIDFERTYPRAFYDHAVRYIVNSVEAQKTRGTQKWKHAVKAQVARGFMRLAQRHT